MGLQEMLFGKPGEYKALPTMAPEQQQLLTQLLGGLRGPTQAGLGNLLNLLGGGTEAFEKPLMRQFYEQTIPGIAERFTGMGAGAQQSSAFKQALGEAGAGLSEQLGALRGGLQMQGLGQLSNLLGMGLGAKPFEWAQLPGTEGFLSPLIGGIGSGLGQGGGFLGLGWLARKLGL